MCGSGAAEMFDFPAPNSAPTRLRTDVLRTGQHTELHRLETVLHRKKCRLPAVSGGARCRPVKTQLFPAGTLTITRSRKTGGCTLRL